jgi:hypothetical protein
MISWPNPNNGDMGIIDLTNKIYTYNSTVSAWLNTCEDKKVNVTKLAPDEATSWNPTINVNEYTTLENISSIMTSLVISMDNLPDSWYSYEYRFKFTTPSTLGITVFSVLDSNGDSVTWLNSAPSLVANKTYEVSIIGNLGIIAGSV